jgi:hypothetical protein
MRQRARSAGAACEGLGDAGIVATHLREIAPPRRWRLAEIERHCRHRADILVRAPASSSRYWRACGEACARNAMGIAAVTALNAENPGVELYRKTYIFDDRPRSV